jgi:GAF domain-containing protein
MWTCPPAGEPDLQRCTSVPLLLGASLVGVLSVYSPEGGCDQNRGRLLEMIAPHIAGALHAAQAGSRSREEPVTRSASEPSAPARTGSWHRSTET